MEKTAMLWNSLTDGKIQCICCAHRCIINPGDVGKCLVRKNENGVCISLNYGKLIAQHVDPIEKKPLYHFYPASKTFSIASAGCNFTCQWCQNWSISQVRDGADIRAMNGAIIDPKNIVRAAKMNNCKSISYTYTEPTIFFEFAYDVSIAAKEAGMMNVFVTNGYMSDELLTNYLPYLDAVNVDIKTFCDDTYQLYCGAHLRPVLDTCRRLKKAGIWLEITTLLIPGINDGQNELTDLATFIRDELGSNTPWHISAFHPDYKLLDRQRTPIHSLQTAKEIGFEKGLKYIYTGNISAFGDTICPNCGRLLIRRMGFDVIKNEITKTGHCPDCESVIDGIGLGKAES